MPQPRQGFLRAYEAGLMPPACGMDDCQASCFTRCVSVQGLLWRDCCALDVCAAKHSTHSVALLDGHWPFVGMPAGLLTVIKSVCQNMTVPRKYQRPPPTEQRLHAKARHARLLLAGRNPVPSFIILCVLYHRCTKTAARCAGWCRWWRSMRGTPGCRRWWSAACARRRTATRRSRGAWPRRPSWRASSWARR